MLLGIVLFLSLGSPEGGTTRPTTVDWVSAGIGSGLEVLVTGWQTYALVATAVAGSVLQQSALKTGVLAPAMASSNAVTLFASVVFGVTIFGEKLSSRHGQLIPALLGLGAALVGVVLLAGTKPPQASTPVPFSDTSPPAEIRPELHPQASSYRSSPSVALHAAGGSEAASSSTAGSAAHRPGPPAERSSPRRVRVDPPPAQGHARRGR